MKFARTKAIRIHTEMTYEIMKGDANFDPLGGVDEDIYPRGTILIYGLKYVLPVSRNHWQE
jgi:hypothetical protein